MNWTTTVIGIAGIVGALVGVGVGWWASAKQLSFAREEGARQRLAEWRYDLYGRIREGLTKVNADTGLLVRRFATLADAPSQEGLKALVADLDTLVDAAGDLTGAIQQCTDDSLRELARDEFNVIVSSLGSMNAIRLKLGAGEPAGETAAELLQKCNERINDRNEALVAVAKRIEDLLSGKA